MMLTQARGGKELNQHGQSKMSKEVIWHGSKSIVEGRDQEDEDHKKQEIGRGQWSGQRRFWQR